jgi:hypothetical protein
VRFIFIIISIILFASCNEKADTRTPERKKIDYCELLENRTTISFVEKMKRKKGLIGIGLGGGSAGPGKGARMLSVTFECYQKVNIAQARMLLLECVQEFLDEINSKQELESCLSVFPFTYKNISISLLFTDKKSNGDFFQPPLIAAAGADEGEMHYVIARDDSLERVKEETYEEALRSAEQGLNDYDKSQNNQKDKLTDTSRDHFYLSKTY